MSALALLALHVRDKVSGFSAVVIHDLDGDLFPRAVKVGKRFTRAVIVDAAFRPCGLRDGVLEFAFGYLHSFSICLLCELSLKARKPPAALLCLPSRAQPAPSAKLSSSHPEHTIKLFCPGDGDISGERRDHRTCRDAAGRGACGRPRRAAACGGGAGRGAPRCYEEAFDRRETALREAPQGKGRPDGTAAGQPRYGEAWTGDEDRALLAKHAAGMSPGEIAAHADHRRSERTIVKRLARLQGG